MGFKTHYQKIWHLGILSTLSEGVWENNRTSRYSTLLPWNRLQTPQKRCLPYIQKKGSIKTKGRRILTSFAKFPLVCYDCLIPLNLPCFSKPCVRAQSCPNLCGPMDCRLAGSSVHGISQARILEWFAFSSSRGSSQPRHWTRVSCISCIGRFFTTVPAGTPSCAFLIKLAQKTQVQLFIWVFVTLWGLLCHIKFILNKSVCFFPINVSLSV